MTALSPAAVRVLVDAAAAADATVSKAALARFMERRYVSSFEDYRAENAALVAAGLKVGATITDAGRAALTAAERAS